MELTKDDTKMIQGLSVLAMVWLHLFDRSYAGLFQPVLFLFGIPLSFYIAQLCDFCVMGFAFCTGYAHYLISDDQDYTSKRKKSLLRLLIKYWIVLAVFCAVSMLTGKGDFMPGSWITLLLSIFAWSSSYNGAWWYLLVYIILVIMSPWLQKLVKKHSSAVILIFGFAIYFIAYLIRFKFTVNNVLLARFGPFGTTLFEYLMGSIAAKEQYFTKVSGYTSKLNKTVRAMFSMLTITVLLLVHTLIIPSLFIAPATGLIILTIFHLWKKPEAVRKAFLYIGSHSTHIWLTHMFFFWNPFKGLVYKALYPVCIFGLLIGITLVVSTVLNCIDRRVFKLLAL